MIIFWKPSIAGGSSTSTDPGVQNVRTGVSYIINGVSLVGTLSPIVLQSATLVGQSVSSVVKGQSLSAKLVQS